MGRINAQKLENNKSLTETNLQEKEKGKQIATYNNNNGNNNM